MIQKNMDEEMLVKQSTKIMKELSYWIKGRKVHGDGWSLGRIFRNVKDDEEKKTQKKQKLDAIIRKHNREIRKAS